MSDPRGALKVSAGGREYTLWLGMSVLADLQSKHGSDVFQKLDPPADAGENWLPDLSIVVDMFLGALQRYHEEEADRYLVDDILAENEDVFQKLHAAAFFEQPKAKVGNAKRSKRAA